MRRVHRSFSIRTPCALLKAKHAACVVKLIKLAGRVSAPKRKNAAGAGCGPRRLAARRGAARARRAAPQPPLAMALTMKASTRVLMRVP